MKRAAAAAILLAALAGCTPADCDPARADLFAGIGCAASGSYDAREATLRSNAAAAQANELEQQARASNARAAQAQAQGDLDHRRNELALLDGRLRALRREIDAAQQRQGVDQAALRDAQMRLSALQDRRAQLTPQSDDAALQALEGPTRELGDQLDRNGLR